MLRLHASRNPVVNAGDLVDVFVKIYKEKRGKWLSPGAVLSNDGSSGPVSVPGLSGCAISEAIEDVRDSIVGDDFAKHVRQSIEQLDECIEDALDSSENTSPLEDEPTGAVRVDECSPDFDYGDDSGLVPVIGDRVEVF